jgi:hypothetical protein
MSSSSTIKYVKYLRAYNDVLQAVLEQRGQGKPTARMVRLHPMIEYGVCDQTLINLMSLGMSRTSAILVKSVRLPTGMSGVSAGPRQFTKS